MFIILSFNFSKPIFLEGHVKRIEIGWDDTKLKAAERLKLLNNTKAAWEAYALGLENIAVEFDKAEEEIKKVKKRFNLQAANDDLALRTKIYNDTHKVITGSIVPRIPKIYTSFSHSYHFYFFVGIFFP